MNKGVAPVEIGTVGLGRELKSRHVAMISIGGIIGAGLFVGSGAAIASIGPAVILTYFIAGIIILAVMRMLGEMATAAPETGSFTEYARLGLGHWAGFLSGWLYWYFWAIVVAIEAIAGATILHEFIHVPVWLISIGLLVVLTAVNLMSTRSYGEFEFWFASIKVAAILAFIAIAGAYAFGVTSLSGNTFANLYAHGGFAPFGPLSVVAGVTSVIFALCGAEIATIAAAESEEPARNVAKLTSSVVIRIALFYVCSIVLIVAVVPWRQIRVGDSPFTAALAVIGIPGAALIMKGVVLTAVLSCLNSGLYITSRVLFALAAHGDAPQALIRVNRRRVPVRAILLGSSVGLLAALTAVLSPDVLFAFLVNASGATMILIYLIQTWAQIRLRRYFERVEPGRLLLKMWVFPWLSYAVALALVTVLLAMALTPGLASQFFSSLFCAGVILAGYAYRRTRPCLVRALDRPAAPVGEMVRI